MSVFDRDVKRSNHLQRFDCVRVCLQRVLRHRVKVIRTAHDGTIISPGDWSSGCEEPPLARPGKRLVGVLKEDGDYLRIIAISHAPLLQTSLASLRPEMSHEKTCAQLPAATAHSGQKKKSRKAERRHVNGVGDSPAPIERIDQ